MILYSSVIICTNKVSAVAAVVGWSAWLTAGLKRPARCSPHSLQTLRSLLTQRIFVLSSLTNGRILIGNRDIKSVEAKLTRICIGASIVYAM